MIRFIAIASIVITYLTRKEYSNSENNINEGVRLKEPLDSGVLFDRFATRFGAFAVVGVICYALVVDSAYIYNARQYSLPGLENSSGTVILIYLLTAMVFLFTSVLGVSTIFPVLSWFEIKLENAGLLKGLGLGVALSVMLVFYASIILVIVFSESLLPALNNDTSSLRHIHICASENLSGALCQEALSICDKAAGPDACIEAVRRHVDALPNDG